MSTTTPQSARSGPCADAARSLDIGLDLSAPPTRWSGVGFAVLTGLVLAACSRPAPPPEPVRAVRLMTVGESATSTQQEFAGEIRARVESSLGFRVAGKLTQRPAETGQRVRAGQLLAGLDPQDYQLATDAARAQLAAASTQRDLAQADVKRFAALKEQNFISSAELERREASLRATQAQVDQAQAQLQAQGNQGRYTQLVADAAGVVTAVLAEPGQVVAVGMPVVRLAHDGPRDAVFAVPEDKLARFAVGLSADVRPWGGASALQGKVREVAAIADPVTRTYLVKLSLAQTAPAPPLGSTVMVRPETGGASAPAVIKLPTSALRRQGQGTAVWVYEPGSQTVRLQDVEVATADGNEAVISQGLSAGQQVVTAGVHVLAPGQKVSIYGAAPQLRSGSASAAASAATSAPASATRPAQ